MNAYRLRTPWIGVTEKRHRLSHAELPMATDLWDVLCHVEAEGRKRGLPRGVMLVIGGERQGLSRAQEALCDERVRIPMVGDVDSLNVAVAAGVLLYEILSRRLP